MFQHLSQIRPDERLVYDVCIIGAGAAGITTAYKLKDAGLKVCLLEGGGFESSAESQLLYQGVSQGYADLMAVRLRFFGGTTNHWTGYCRAPEEPDLEAREWEPPGEWPIPRAEFNRYVLEAMDIVEIPNRFDVAYWAARRRVIQLSLQSADFHEKVSLISPPVRFKDKFRAAIDQSRSVICILEATVVELLPSRDGDIEQITVKTLDGHASALRARVYVLACGGIENARLLLNSNSRIPAGLGNSNDLVGRFFSDHCVRSAGSAVLTRPAGSTLIYELGRFNEGNIGIVPHLQTDVSFAAKQQLPRVVIRLVPEPTTRTTRLMERVAGMWNGGVSRSFRLIAFAEPLSAPQNRITLLPERDKLGVRRAKLTYKPTDLESKAIVESLRRLAAVIGAAGRGRIQIDTVAISGPSDDWGFHHFGTTRMHADPKHGVVDKDCRVHGIKNLFVAGSSVLPRAGLLSPTIVIVGLALRLADKVKQAIDA